MSGRLSSPSADAPRNDLAAPHKRDHVEPPLPLCAAFPRLRVTVNIEQPVMARCNWLAMAALIASCLAYSPLGWCPPFPDLGVFVPDEQTYDFGSVPIGTARTIGITLVVALASASMSPYVIGTFGTFFAFATQSFSLDPVGTTCIPGAIVTTVSGCVVSVTFAPHSLSGQQVARIGVAAAPSSSPASVNTVAIDDFTASAVAPAPVPALSTTALFLLAVALIAAAVQTMRVRIRRSKDR
jgi:hypothetical protein